ncbi:MAG: arsenate reductase (glutaredoxin) [Lentisphaeraceae bacterium]|nr:arsenate reductase (glutaredoxin) [Lentisphaeraceae bacterium]
MNKLYHNPRCSKSRQTKELLEQNGADFEVVEYLKDIPTEKEIKELVKALGLASAHDLMRTKETVYKEKNIASLKGEEDLLIKAMIENPILIERPIFSVNGKAAIGRPPESVLELI